MHARELAREMLEPAESEKRERGYPMIKEKWMSGRGGTKITPHECGHWGPSSATLATSHVPMHVKLKPFP